jgi:hypothetical protein
MGCSFSENMSALERVFRRWCFTSPPPKKQSPTPPPPPRRAIVDAPSYSRPTSSCWRHFGSFSLSPVHLSPAPRLECAVWRARVHASGGLLWVHSFAEPLLCPALLQAETIAAPADANCTSAEITPCEERMLANDTVAPQPRTRILRQRRARRISPTLSSTPATSRYDCILRCYWWSRTRDHDLDLTCNGQRRLAHVL